VPSSAVRAQAALFDSSTYVDVQRAPKHLRKEWAQNTLHHWLEYRTANGRLAISALTLFELLDGLHRGQAPGELARFRTEALPFLEVIYPNRAIVELAAQINAALGSAGLVIGVPDVIIAATAISEGLVLVNSNTRHFERVRTAGFPLEMENWRNP